MTNPETDHRAHETQIRALSANLRAASTLDDVKTCLDEMLPDVGFDRYTYLAVDVGAGQDRGLSQIEQDATFLTNLSPTWLARYLERKYFDCDPVAHACSSSRSPVIWTQSQYPAAVTESAQEMMDDAAAHGICRGVSIPVHGFAGELGILSLYSALPDEAFLAAVDAHEIALQRLAFELHDVIHRRFVKRAAGASVTEIVLRDRSARGPRQ
jgi:hypothetical protein